MLKTEAAHAARRRSPQIVGLLQAFSGRSHRPPRRSQQPAAEAAVRRKTPQQLGLFKTTAARATHRRTPLRLASSLRDVGPKNRDPTSSISDAQNKSKRFTWIFRCGNDPSAGSPTETLLRLHLPLNGEVRKSSHKSTRNEANGLTVPISHRVIQSVGATGGVYKGQGRNQCKLMTCVY